MPAEDTIARNVAHHLAPEIDPRLPTAVASALAKARGEDTAYRSADPAQLIALAGLLVSAASLAWAVHMGQWQRQQPPAPPAQANPDRAAIKRAIVDRLTDEIPHLAKLESGLRERMLSAVVEETLAEADRRDIVAR